MKNKKKINITELPEIYKTPHTSPEEPEEFDVSIPNGTAIRLEEIEKDLQNKTNE